MSYGKLLKSAVMTSAMISCIAGVSFAGTPGNSGTPYRGSSAISDKYYQEIVPDYKKPYVIYEDSAYSKFFVDGINTEAGYEAKKEAVIEATRMGTQMITSRIMDVFSPEHTLSPHHYAANTAGPNSYVSGMASGDDYDYVGYSIWGLGAYSDVNITKSGYKSDSNIAMGMIGADKLVMNNKLAVGFAAGFEKSRTNPQDSWDEDYSGITLSPYAAYRVTDDFTVKGILSFGLLEYDDAQFSVTTPDPFVHGVFLTNYYTVKGYESFRFSTDISGEYTWHFDDLTVAAEAGFMYVNENFDPACIEDISLGEGRLSAKASYLINNKFEPYVRGTIYQHLFGNSDRELSKQLWEGALGLNYYAGRLVISLEGQGSVNEDKDGLGGSFLIRYEF